MTAWSKPMSDDQSADVLHPSRTARLARRRRGVRFPVGKKPAEMVQ